ncbi:MAG: cytochrome ubiquinol oxidase subunit I [Micrococcales bacterium]|nr:cytochrome ubiquinol oxidase subunit I [Micrococcales bacterium]
MDNLTLARWQFGITTVYHFIFVPLTIGLSLLVALLQTFWVKTGKDEWFRLTRFFGKLLLINFALGIVTGIVQEFQFGMNWSEYSRYVGDIFGAPLAMEALAAFFIESTFLGIWIFGWGRLKRGVHLATIWLVAFATSLSAFFILAANSFMQYPVGATIDQATGRAQMDNLAAMLFSDLSLSTFWHTLSTSFFVAGTFMAGIAIWWMVKAVRAGDEAQAKNVWRKGAYVGLVTVLVSGASLVWSGHHQAVLMTQIQPTKMAAAEALCVTPPAGEGAGFTIAAFGDCAPGKGDENMSHFITIPGMLSWLATWDTTAPFAGADQLNKEFSEAFPEMVVAQDVVLGEDGDFLPPVMATFWSFRVMLTLGIFSAVLALWGLWALRGGRVSGSAALGKLAVLSLPMPFLAGAAGWIFTEIGRQPWIVAPIYSTGGPSVIDPSMATSIAVTPGEVVSPTYVWISMVGLTLLYAVLAVAWFYLMKRYTSKGLNVEESVPDPKADLDDSKPLTFSY